MSVTTGSFLKDIDQFDHIEFGVSTKDAKAMAPATRKLVETSFLALLDSGIEYRRRNVGCYMSGTSIELLNVSEPVSVRAFNLSKLIRGQDEYDSQGSFASTPAMIANRVSYILDLLGPSVPTDTACSSTATALHLAIQGVRYGECEAAIVGGCQLNHRCVLELYFCSLVGRLGSKQTLGVDQLFTRIITLCGWQM